MNFRLLSIVLLVAVSAVAGCKSILPQSWSRTGDKAPVATRSPLQTAELLEYFARVRKMSRDEVQAEITQSRQTVGKSATPYNQLKFAMLLALPSTGRDTQKALAALDELHKDEAPQDSDLRNLADYLQPLLAWQAKEEDVAQSLTQAIRRDDGRRGDGAVAGQVPDAAALQAMSQKVRDEQRRAEVDRARQDETIQSLTQKLKDEQKRGDLLQQKLDAITSLEKSILDRKPNKPDTSGP